MVYRTVPISMTVTTPNPTFKVMPLFNAEYVRNSARYTHSYNELLTGTYALLKRVISNDLEKLSKIFNDMKHRTVSLRQLSFLLLIVEIMLAGCILMTEQLTNESQIRSQFSNWLWLEDISNPMPKNFHSPSGKFSLVAWQLSDDLMQALHKVITNVWSTGRVPAEWKEGIIVSLYKGKARSLSAVVTGRFLFCLYREKYYTYPSGAHSASTWQVPQTSTVWFYCRAVYYGCHISLEIVGRVTPKF